MGVSLQNPLALLLLPLGALVWYWHRSRRLAQRPATALWLLEAGSPRRRARRWPDLRLLALLGSFGLLVLALSGPSLSSGRPERLVVVLDASASMAARDRPGGASRIEDGKRLAARWLEGAGSAVLVRAGLTPTTYGPAEGRRLLDELSTIRAGDAAADLERAAAAGRRLLAGAPVLVISDAAPPPNVAGYANVAGQGKNAGITALGGGFAAVYNASRTTWKGSLESDGERFDLQVAPGRYAVVRFSGQKTQRRARLNSGGVLALDDVAYYAAATPAVSLEFRDPALTRALLAAGARPGSEAAAAVVTLAPPPPEPAARPTVYFAPHADAAVTVADVDPTDPLTRGVALVGRKLPSPEPPAGNGWRPLVRDAAGNGLVWRRGQELYLPPLAAWRDEPALVVLLYNWLEPLKNGVRPLGADGVLRPGLRAGTAYSLLSATETNLPRPRPDRLAGLRPARPLSGWLALAAALLLLAAGRPKVPRRKG